MEQKIKSEGLVRRLDDFSRFLEAISLSHGQVLNVAAVARECAASRNTVESYITILEDLLLAVRLPAFTRRGKRATITHSKFFLFDCGLFRSLRPGGPFDADAEISGPALQGLVFEHLRAWLDYRRARLRLHFWRTQAGNDVDFVLYGADGFHALEVKTARSVRPEDLRGLKSFREDYPECSTALLCRGEEAIERDGILCPS